ncbi:hypothetical protein KC359_g237 [Hortaea werneckii]|nr:hypothetical protein KC359_g237 [Hortaea werneckii]
MSTLRHPLGPLGKMTGSPNPGEPTSTIQRFPSGPIRCELCWFLGCIRLPAALLSHRPLHRGRKADHLASCSRHWRAINNQH